MKVSLWLKETSQPIIYEDVKNTYTKGYFYCIYASNEEVYKWPIFDIFRTVEDYGRHSK